MPIKYDHKFINEYWGASPSRQVNMWKQHPEKMSSEMMRTIAPHLKEELNRSQSRLNEFQRLDKKWNSGSQSSDTYFQKGTVSGKQKTVDSMANQLRGTMNDWRSSPAQKESAQRTLKALTGKDR